jgi:cytochrome c553
MEKPVMMRFHMQRHFDDLRMIERMLVAGKLDDAKARAFLLTRPAPDPGMAPWATDVEAVTEAARALVAAPGVDEALRRETRVAKACAYCHLRVQKSPVFLAAPPAPRYEPTPAARMARHQWSVDRLWEGIVGPSDRSWRAGLDVLASTPLPLSPLTDAPSLATHLQELARGAPGTHGGPAELIEDRARLYGEMLVTCAACHDSARRR